MPSGAVVLGGGSPGALVANLGALPSPPIGASVRLWDLMSPADRTSLLAGTATDQSTAFTAAVAALPGKGGTIELPPGLVLLNNTVTKDGVIVRGQGALSNNFTSGVATVVRPAANASPALTWGNGSTQVRGGCLRDCSVHCNADISGGTSSKGVLVQGVKSFLLHHCNILGGPGYALRVAGGASSSAVTESFTATCCELGTRSDQPGPVVQMEYNPSDSTSWCEGIALDNCYVTGPTSGTSFMLDITGVVDLRLLGGYYQATSTRGIYLARKTTGTNYIGSGTILAAATKFDSADTNPEMIKWDESNLILGFHLTGTWKMHNGALARSTGLGATIAIDQDSDGYAFDAGYQNIMTAHSFHSGPARFAINTAPLTEIGNVAAASSSNFKLRANTGKGLLLSADGDSGTGTITMIGDINFSGAANVLKVNGTQVVAARQTGFTAGTGTPNKGAFAADSATAVQAAQRILAIEQALRAHGLIN